MKRKKIIMWIHVYSNWKTNFNSKNGRKISFSRETKASKSFIPMRRMWLWSPIMKKRDYYLNQCLPNWKVNLNSKNSGKRSFSYKTKASKSFITISKMCLWCPIMNRNEIIMWIHVYPNWKMNFDSKNGRKWSFSYKN